MRIKSLYILERVWPGLAVRNKADEYFVLFLVSFAVHVVNREMLSLIASIRVAAVEASTTLQRKQIKFEQL